MSNSFSKSIKKRFEQIQILKDFDCFNIVKIKEIHEYSLKNYGNEKLKNLLNFYFRLNPEFLSNEINEELCLEQYGLFKSLISRSWNHMENDEIIRSTLICDSLNEFKKMFRLYLVLPLSSVECERVFSHMNLITTLKTETVDKLIFISRNGPEIENFRFEDAFIHWKSGKTR